MVTEFDPSIPNDSKTGAVSITDSTIWGGIYAAEFIMRMSTVPGMLYVGPHSLIRFSGILSANAHSGDVMRAANQGKPIDTLSLDFGYYVSAQASGLGILNGVINHAVQSNKTVVTGGVTVPATGIGGGIPALYAVSYTNGGGGSSVVITNKSATAHRVTIRVNGAAATGTFPLQFVASADPSAANTPGKPNNVAIQKGTSANPVTVPAYSVVRVDLKIPALVTVVNAASQQPVPLAPTQQGMLLGSGLASDTLTADTDPPPTVLGDTTITIVDSAGNVFTVPIFSVSPQQATFLMPDTIVAGTAKVTVARGGKNVLTGSFHRRPDFRRPLFREWKRSGSGRRHSRGPEPRWNHDSAPGLHLPGRRAAELSGGTARFGRWVEPGDSDFVRHRHSLRTIGYGIHRRAACADPGFPAAADIRPGPGGYHAAAGAGWFGRGQCVYCRGRRCIKYDDRAYPVTRRKDIGYVSAKDTTTLPVILDTPCSISLKNESTRLFTTISWRGTASTSPSAWSSPNAAITENSPFPPRFSSPASCGRIPNASRRRLRPICRRSKVLPL
jgi:hypothetical protein